MRHLVQYLKDRISNETPLPHILAVFEQMCQIPVAEDMILFETGTYHFAGELMFWFSLVRQIPHPDEENDEYLQIHVDVLYTPTRKNKTFHEATWNINLEKNIFEYIQTSEVFSKIKNETFSRIEIYLCET